jgi:hypothetical protein
MAKITLTDIAAGYLSIATYNANNTLIETALENTLSRDGTSPNTMSANLDMNSNKVTNITDGTSAQDAVSKAQLDAIVASAGAVATLVDLTDVTSATATNKNVLAANGSSWVSRALVEADISDLGTYLASVQAGDVDAEASTDGYVLTSDGAGNAAWEAAPGAGGVTELVDLSDVTTAAVTNRYALMANGSAYVGRAIVEADVSDLQSYLVNVVEDTTPQLGGDLDVNSNDINMGGQALNCADGLVTRPVLKDFGLASTSPASTAGAVTFDLSTGNAFQHTLDENVTSITLSNPPASGTYGECIIKFIQDGTGSRTVAGWPASVKWPGGTAPTITTTLTTGTDLIVLKTWDAGTTWYGDFSQDYS